MYFHSNKGTTVTGCSNGIKLKLIPMIDINKKGVMGH